MVLQIQRVFQFASISLLACMLDPPTTGAFGRFGLCTSQKPTNNTGSWKDAFKIFHDLGTKVLAMMSLSLDGHSNSFILALQSSYNQRNRCDWKLQAAWEQSRRLSNAVSTVFRLPSGPFQKMTFRRKKLKRRPFYRREKHLAATMP